MSKISTDPATPPGMVRHALNGPTMGTRWTALFHARPGFDPAPVQAALQAAVALVDAQMSTWQPDSDLMRLNRAPVGDWVAVPPDLAFVLTLGLRIGAASGGAFDMGLGDVVAAWGYGPAQADPGAIRAAMATPRQPAHQAVQVQGARARKTAPITLDLNGIAKGHGVDRLAGVLQGHGITAALVGIDGEMRAFGLRPDATAWTIAIEAPDTDRRAAHSVLALHDAGVATSGDYRHFVDVGGRRLSHTMDPARAAPLLAPPASVTVVAATCAEADAWATALMVAGPVAGAGMARQQGLDALFLLRDDAGGVTSQGVGPVFGTGAMAPDQGEQIWKTARQTG